MEMSCGIQVAEYALFWQFEGDYVNERVLERVGSCSSSVRMFRKCTKFLPKLVCAEMKVVVQNASFLTL